MKILKESEFTRNVMTLLTGSFFAQLIPFLVLPILQRYFYSPADFGMFAVFISFFELFSVIACLKLELGIVLQNTVRKAINLAYSALQISWVIAAVSFVVVFLFKQQIAYRFGVQGLENYLFLVPIYVLIAGYNDVLTYWFNRKKAFKTLAVIKTVQSSTAETVKLSTGLLKFDFFGLIIGRVFGLFSVSIYLTSRFLKQDRKALRLIRNSERKKSILQNKNFIYFTTPSVLLGSFINVMYLQLFLHYFGKDIVGQIGVSMTYLFAGFGIVSISFSQVFYAKLAETNGRENLLRMYLHFTRNLAILACIPVAFLYLLPVKFVVYFLGDSWSDLLPIARIMSIWLAVWFVSSSLSFIYMRLGKQKTMLFYDVLHLILVVAGFYLAINIDMSYTAALWGFTIAKVILYLIVICVAIFFIKRSKE